MCCTCHFQSGFFCLFGFFCLQVSAVSNFCPDTKGWRWSLVRLTCSVVLCGARNTANKCHWPVWGALAASRPHWVRPCLQPVCFPSLHCSGSRLLCRERVLGCVHWPGLRHSGSGSRVLHKGADLVVPVFCALPWSEQLRQPGASWAHSPQVVSVSYHLPSPSGSVSWVAVGMPVSGVPCVSSG